MLLCGWNSDRTGERKYHTTIPRLVAAIAMASVIFVGNNVIGYFSKKTGSFDGGLTTMAAGGFGRKKA